MKAIGVFRAVLTAGLSLLTMANAHAASEHMRCSDIRKIDLRNKTIEIGGHVFAFHDGVSLEYGDRDEEPRNVEWKANIENEISVQVAATVAVRFLFIHDVHEAGSGWRYYVVAYGCFGGFTKQVFERDGLSLRIDKLDQSALVLSVIPSDNVSGRKYFSYVWGGSASKYVLTSTWLND
jgi:hypothetical protein